MLCLEFVCLDVQTCALIQGQYLTYEPNCVLPFVPSLFLTVGHDSFSLGVRRRLCNSLGRRKTQRFRRKPSLYSYWTVQTEDTEKVAVRQRVIATNSFSPKQTFLFLNATMRLNCPKTLKHQSRRKQTHPRTRSCKQGRTHPA